MRSALIFCLVTLLLFSCAEQPGEEVPAGEGELSPQNVTQVQSHKKRSLLIFMDADNGLDDYRDNLSQAITDINELEEVGSTEDLHILVMIDRQAYSKPETPVIYYIQKDQNNSIVSSPVIKSLSELNMGLEATLVDFLDYAKRTFPSDETVLVFWSHGNGWKPFKDTTSKSKTSQPNHTIGHDNSHFGDGLDPDELRLALENQNHIHWILFDACLMASVEVLYEIKDSAEFFLASQSYLPASGFQYRILADLLSQNNSLEQTTGDFLSSMKDYIQTLERTQKKGTLSLIQSSEMINLALGLNNFFAALSREDYQTSAQTLTANDPVDQTLKDLGQWIDSIETQYPDQYESLKEIYSLLISGHYHTDQAIAINSYDHLSGLNINLPASLTDLKQDSDYYRSLSFVQDSGLGAFLSQWE